MNPDNNPSPQNKLNISPYLRLGLIILGSFVLIFGAWSFFTPIEGASVSEGKVIVNTIRKNIQHLKGGRIEEFFVKEGDFVKAGDPLIQLDAAEDMIQYKSLMNEYYQNLASKARYDSFLRGDAEIQFPEILLKNKNNENVKDIIAKENEHFYAQKQSIKDQILVLNQEIAKHTALIKTAKARIVHQEKLRKLYEDEEKELIKLREENLVSKPRLLAVQREMVKGEESVVSLKGSIEDSRKEIDHAKAQKQFVVSKSLQEAADQRLEIERKLIDVEGKLALVKESLEHTLITSPIDGTVLGLRYHTVGGIIRSSEPIMEIVPVNDQLIIEAIINPIDIDVVKPHLKAKVDFLPYMQQRDAPILDGEVTLVSPDIFLDEKTNHAYYKAYIKISQQELAKAPKIHLYPGMPVQVMIVNDQRTPFQYFITPIIRSFNRAFREK